MALVMEDVKERRAMGSLKDELERVWLEGEELAEKCQELADAVRAGKVGRGKAKVIADLYELMADALDLERRLIEDELKAKDAMEHSPAL